MDSTTQDQHEIHRVKRGRPPKTSIEPPEVQETPSQRLAMRVWEGQSESLSPAFRIARIKSALELQGLTLDGVELPLEGWRRYA